VFSRASGTQRKSFSTFWRCTELVNNFQSYNAVFLQDQDNPIKMMGFHEIVVWAEFGGIKSILSHPAGT